MSLSILKIQQQAKKFNILGLGEIFIREMTIGDNVKVQEWMQANKDEDDNVPMDRFMVMKCLASIVDEKGNHLDVEDANGNAIVDDNSKIDALIGSLPSTTMTELFKACNEVNKPPVDVAEKKSKS